MPSLIRPWPLVLGLLATCTAMPMRAQTPSAQMGPAGSGLFLNGIPAERLFDRQGEFTGGLALGAVAGREWPTTLTNSVQLPNYSIVRGNAHPLATYTDANGSFHMINDWTTPPDALRLGGAVEYDSAPLLEHCYPYANDGRGACLQVSLGSQNVQGLNPGIGPGRGTQIPDYDNFDVAGFTNRISGATPIFTATAASENVQPASSDGLDHTPDFTATGASFANPLPADISAWLKTHTGTRVMTNEVGCASCAIQTYAGIVDTLRTDGQGRVTGLTVNGGWRVFGSHDNSPNQIPGRTTTDHSRPQLDSVWSRFHSPALMFGVYTKGFNQYSLCQTSGPRPDARPGDINFPTGNRNQQMRACEGWEMDLFQDDPKDGRAIHHGITVVESKHAGTLSADSYNFLSAGATPVAYKMTGEYYTMPIAAPSFRVAGYGGPAYTAGATSVLADFAQQNRYGYDSDGDHGRHVIRTTLWNVRNVDAKDEATRANDYHNITTALGVQVDGGAGGTTPPRMDGTVQEHLEFNPKQYPNGIVLCGYKLCGLGVDGKGSPVFDADARVNGGHELAFRDGSGVKAAAVHAGDTDHALHVTPATPDIPVVVDGSLRTANVVEGRTLVAAADATVGGQLNLVPHTWSTLTPHPVRGTEQYCTDCWSQNARTAHGHARPLPVFWDGSAWTDALGDPVGHS